MAEDYFEELKEFTKQESFSERDCVIQFPYVAPVQSFDTTTLFFCLYDTECFMVADLVC